MQTIQCWGNMLTLYKYKEIHGNYQSQIQKSGYLESKEREYVGGWVHKGHQLSNFLFFKPCM